MDKKESLALYKQGKKVWNVWAIDMLDKKSKLENDGQWQITASGEGDNQVTREWLHDSEVNFNEHTFEGKVDFDNFIFPNMVGFVDTIFNEVVTFESAIFRGKVYFNRAKFRANAWLKSTKFSNYTVFDSVEFSGYARFHDAIFKDKVLFDQIVFKGFADFSNTISEKKVSFIAIQGEGFFSFKDAKFYLVPDFTQAHFIEAPQFDNSDFSKALKHSQSNDTDNLSSNWRSLKRLAIQGHDHERKLIFFAEEIKSQRGVQDKLLPKPLNYWNNKPVWPGGTRYWLGGFYQYLSDFGRSVMRPIFWLLFLVLSFHFLYMKYPIEDKPIHYDSIFQVTIPCERSEAALYLSAHSALPFTPAASYSENINRNYACLYGKDSDGKANVPNAIVILSIIQTMLSTILIFLILLALRNHFRIK